MAFPLLPIHVLCFFAKSLDQFVKWHLSVCVCLGPELRAPTRTHLCRYSSPSPGRTISGLKRDACSRLVCGGLLRVCHYPGYNLHALWWGPFIQLSFPPSPPHPIPIRLQFRQYHLALLQLFIHTSMVVATIPATVIKKSLVISFLPLHQLAGHLCPAIYVRFL